MLLNSSNRSSGKSAAGKRELCCSLCERVVLGGQNTGCFVAPRRRRRRAAATPSRTHLRSATHRLLLSTAPLQVLGRVATGFSILFGFPLAMVGLRNSVVGMCESLADDATTALPPSVCSALLAVADDGNRFMLVVRTPLPRAAGPPRPGIEC